jgi:hypothetical protein
VTDRQKLRFPLTSLTLLFLTYATVGWLLHDWTSNRVVWLLVGFGTVVLGGIATYPSRSVSLGFGGFFKTDVRALILIVLGSVVTVALLTWLQFFVDAVILCTAGLLVSLDLKIRGWSNPSTLLIIIGWQLLGMSAGLGLHHLYLHPIMNLPPYFYTDYWLQLTNRPESRGIRW